MGGKGFLQEVEAKHQVDEASGGAATEDGIYMAREKEQQACRACVGVWVRAGVYEPVGDFPGRETEASALSCPPSPGLADREVFQGQ